MASGSLWNSHSDTVEQPDSLKHKVNYNWKLINLVCRCCTENIDARFSFDTFKLGQYFSTKDPVPKSLISHVIYLFSCTGCNACYVGETARHFEKRVDEHLRTDKKSAVYKHLKANPACKRSSNVECFSILDKARTGFQLAVKEAMYIKERDPVLNRQVVSYKLKLLLQVFVRYGKFFLFFTFS